MLYIICTSLSTVYAWLSFPHCLWYISVKMRIRVEGRVVQEGQLVPVNEVVETRGGKYVLARPLGGSEQTAVIWLSRNNKACVLLPGETGLSLIRSRSGTEVARKPVTVRVPAGETVSIFSAEGYGGGFLKVSVGNGNRGSIPLVE